MHRSHVSGSVVAMGIAAAILPGGAIKAEAQTAPGVPAPASAPVAPTQEPAATEGLQDIVVTAQRRSENLQRAAIAVSAVSSATLTAEVTQGQDLAKIVPSVQIGAGGGGTNLTSIRGIGTLASNGLAEQVVAINVDGVYFARPAAANGLYYDLERIEVLKGPQGTLYGRNATAGAINIITRRPVIGQLAGTIDGEVGNFDLYRLQGALNVPVSDTVAVRISGQGVHRNGYLSDGYNDEKHYSGRASLLAKPNNDLSILLTADYVHFGGQGSANVVSPFVDPSNPYLGPTNPLTAALYRGTTLNGFLPNGLPPVKDDGFNNSDFYGISGNIDWSTSVGTFTILPAYRRSDILYRHYAPGVEVDDRERSDQKSLEVRYATPEDKPLRGIFGAYYFGETGDFKLDPYVFAPRGAYPGPSTVTVDKYETTSLAAFGQFTYSLTSAFRLIGGLRYTNEKKEVRGNAFDPFTLLPSPIDGNLEFNRVNWRAGVEADVGPRSLFYATAATGFKAGGIFAGPRPNTYQPESLTAYTVGSKNRFLDNTLQLNAEVFYWKYKDKQVTHQEGPTLVTENAGEATLYGAEIESSIAITSDDLISANVLYNHTRYDDFTFLLPPTSAWNCPRTPAGGGNDLVNCSGNVLQQAPRWSANADYQHTFRLSSGARLVALASGKYRSSHWLGDEQLVGQKQASYATGDASLTYNAPADRWYVTAYVENIADKAVKNNSFVIPLLNQPGVGLFPPRTYGIRAGVRL